MIKFRSREIAKKCAGYFSDVELDGDVLTFVNFDQRAFSSAIASEGWTMFDFCIVHGIHDEVIWVSGVPVQLLRTELPATLTITFSSTPKNEEIS